MTDERIDKWLWAVRIYKTRTIATDACKKGRISVGGVTVKPSRTIKPGDEIQVRKPPVTYTFRVKALAPNRLGARLVPEYLENLTPKSELDLLDVVKISGFIDRRKGLGRPTKREGREMARFKDDATGYDMGWDFPFDDDDNDDDDTANSFMSDFDE